MMKVIKVTTDQERENFLDLPRRLYGKKTHQDDAVVRQFLEGTHPLSDDADIGHYLLCREGEAAGRMTLTQYPGSDTLYLGYFECIDDMAAAGLLIRQARQEAAERGLSSVTGPVDVSFWVGYRFKISQFDQSFMGEPQNMAYYPGLFEKAGFRPIRDYVSHYHRRIPADYELTKFQARSRMIRGRGIRIIHPDFRQFDRYLIDIHGLLMELYRDFPAFVPIGQADFTAMFRDLKLISDPRLIVMAYDGEVPVGFFISFPDYQNHLLSKRRLVRLWYLLTVKWTPRRIVLSYSGVRRGYEGLSGALYLEVLSYLKKKQLPGVSTLMQKGKVTSGFEKGLVESTTQYRLYELKV